MSAPFDTGYIVWTQPGTSATFAARLWGDEFAWWMETSDGYRVVQGVDGIYYYAQLNSNGNYTPTNLKAGIDSPPSSSYKLNRSSACLSNIQQQRAAFNNVFDSAAAWFAQKQAQAGNNPVVLNIGVIFAEFIDVPHFTASSGVHRFGYLKSEFDSMMFSRNYWTGLGRHPEGDTLYGSMSDYFFQMSRGKLILHGTLLNPSDGNGVPQWMALRSGELKEIRYRLNGGIGLFASKAQAKNGFEVTLVR